MEKEISALGTSINGYKIVMFLISIVMLILCFREVPSGLVLFLTLFLFAIVSWIYFFSSLKKWLLDESVPIKSIIFGVLSVVTIAPILAIACKDYFELYMCFCLTLCCFFMLYSDAPQELKRKVNSVNISFFFLFLFINQVVAVLIFDQQNKANFDYIVICFSVIKFLLEYLEFINGMLFKVFIEPLYVIFSLIIKFLINI